ncbi:PREDICTED: ankyrin repeat domain-containing protein 50-like [Amphimedon queenslandica]|uniref:Ankyrin repeat protein n=1 Tax=Amphimedon queenslandica TaxID=400682 RepID=A0AAN0K2D0_AMPQE|nr:PREDICTED: ankyrin repeat domain-containing protein 50-like [Amphimedon queenslandica]|eukprot:XP_019863302.1 PREDICTED: ankyrin repeat domain-containing protein 50-like [Amphimedon queenslandica]
MIACECGHKDIILTLLENGADPSICDNDGNNALHYALLTSSSEDNTIDIIQTLLSWHVNVNAQNKKKVTPLMIASDKGYTEVLLLLLEEADPNITDSKGDTALMRASANGKSEAVALLLMTYNANPSVTNYYGSTALCHAANNGHIEVITVLLSNYNPNQEEMEKAVTAACYGGHKNLIKLLVDKINLTKYQQDIFTACVSDNVEYIINQISSDLSRPLIQSTNLTPLMIASSCGSDEVVQTLLLDLFDSDVNKTR